MSANASNSTNFTYPAHSYIHISNGMNSQEMLNAGIVQHTVRHQVPLSQQLDNQDSHAAKVGAQMSYLMADQVLVRQHWC